MFFIENIVFWAFVFTIVLFGCETPAIVFSGFSLFLFYWILRFLFQKEGWERVTWFYVINMFVCILLLYYYITGNTYQKGLRGMLNSIGRMFPRVEPYMNRC